MSTLTCCTRSRSTSSAPHFPLWYPAYSPIDFSFRAGATTNPNTFRSTFPTFGNIKDGAGTLWETLNLRLVMILGPRRSLNDFYATVSLSNFHPSSALSDDRYIHSVGVDGILILVHRVLYFSVYWKHVAHARLYRIKTSIILYVRYQHSINS